jgi:hypothetical protein
MAVENPKLANDIDFCLTTRRLGFGYPYAETAILIENLVAMKTANRASATHCEPVINCRERLVKDAPCKRIVAPMSANTCEAILDIFGRVLAGNFDVLSQNFRLTGLFKNQKSNGSISVVQ